MENRRGNVSGTDSGSGSTRDEHASIGRHSPSPPRENNNLNMSPEEEEMIQNHFGLLRLQSNRTNAGGPIRTRDIQRGSNRALPYRSLLNQYDPMNLTGQRYFPRIELSNSRPNASTMLPTGVRAGMLRLAGGNNYNASGSGSAVSARIPYASQGITTFGHFAYEANPWLRYTNHRHSENIEEAVRNYATMLAFLAIAANQMRNNAFREVRRRDGYNPLHQFPAFNPLNNVATRANSEEGGIGISQAISEEVNSHHVNMDEVQSAFGDDSSTKCSLCLGELVADSSNRRRCGHYIHYTCIMTYDWILDCYFCHRARRLQGD